MKFLTKSISHCAPTLATALLTGGQLLAAPADLPPVRGLEEVGHAQVELRGGFWRPRLNAQHEATVPHALKPITRGTAACG